MVKAKGQESGVGVKAREFLGDREGRGKGEEEVGMVEYVRNGQTGLDNYIIREIKHG